jgi:hypothetical protein
VGRIPLIPLTEELTVDQTLCALAAGLLLGQAQDVTIVPPEPVQPKCNCAASAKTGWTQTQTSTQSRTWTQTGTWTPSTGWTWSNSVKDGTEDRSFVSRFTDRVSSLFGSKQETTRQTTGWQTTGWQTTGWVDVDPQDDEHESPIQASSGPVASAISPLRIAEQHYPRRMPSGIITSNEPPLLEVTANQPTPASAQAIKPASFQPAQAPVIAALAAKSQVQAKTNYGHEDDYSWISGPIDIVNGAHVLQYATPGTADRFGGHMILSGDPDLSQLEKGDLVKIHGSVVPGRTISIYRVRSIEIVERAAK